MKKDSIFAADHKLLLALEERSLPISCSNDRILFCQEEAPRGLYILQGGEAALTMKSASGKVVMCLRAEAGSLLGLPAIIANEPYSMTAMVRKGSEVRFVTRHDFEDLMRADPSLSLEVLPVLAAEVRAARQAFSEV
jgi:CRP-like cAMP-binding protein